MFWQDLAFPYKEKIKKPTTTHLKHSTYSWNRRRRVRNAQHGECPPPTERIRAEWKQLSLKFEDWESASVCSQLCVGSAQLGYTHLKGYINTREEQESGGAWPRSCLIGQRASLWTRPWETASEGDDGGMEKVMLTASWGPQKEESDVLCLPQPPTNPTFLQSWRISSSNKHHSKAGARAGTREPPLVVP